MISLLKYIFYAQSLFLAHFIFYFKRVDKKRRDIYFLFFFKTRMWVKNGRKE
jgi:hypothetical protein